MSFDEEVLRECIEPIDHPDVRAMLKELIPQLKCGSGEQWAIGETLARLVLFIEAEKISNTLP